MDQHSTFRIAESYFQSLLRSGHDTLQAARDIEDPAAFLASEGQSEVAQALREISLQHRRAEACEPTSAPTEVAR